MRERDTSIGGAGRRFPPTHVSLVERVGAADADDRREAWDTLIAAYWKPVYTYIRLTWGTGNEDAKDLTQGFFAAAMEKGFFAPFDPARARFRTWLRTCLHGWIAKEVRAGRRLKRGGDAEHVELRDDAGADDEALDERFHQEWVRAVFTQALARLDELGRHASREIAVAVFRRYDVDGADAGTRPTYAELAFQLGIPPTQVTNYLSWARREFRTLVLDVLREGAGSDADYRADVQELLGMEAP